MIRIGATNPVLSRIIKIMHVLLISDRERAERCSIRLNIQIRYLPAPGPGANAFSRLYAQYSPAFTFQPPRNLPSYAWSLIKWNYKPIWLARGRTKRFASSHETRSPVLMFLSGLVLSLFIRLLPFPTPFSPVLFLVSYNTCVCCLRCNK